MNTAHDHDLYICPQRARARQRFGYLLGALLSGALCAVSTACRVEGENSVSRHLVKPVEVILRGRVVDTTTDEGIANAELQLLEAPVGKNQYDEVSDARTTSLADGSFELEVTLDVEQFSYLLRASDPAELFSSDSNTSVYALKDQTIEVGDIELTPARERLLGTITGTVYAAVGGVTGVPPLEGATVVALDPASQVELGAAATTDESGHFELSDVPFEDVDLRVTLQAQTEAATHALSTSTTYRLSLGERVPERGDAGDALLDVGRFWIPTSKRRMQGETYSEDYLTILLSWEPGELDSCSGRAPDEEQRRDLDARLYLPGADCDINHLGGQELGLLTGAALDPIGMGSGTCFWPPFLGGANVSTIGEDPPSADGTELRVLLSEQRPFQLLVRDPYASEGAAAQSEQPTKLEVEACPDLSVQGARPSCTEASAQPGTEDCGFAVLDHTSGDGSEPEVVTLYKNRYTRDWPTELGYYYELEVTDEGERSRRYPMAVAAFTVVDRGSALNGAKPVVEVYEAGERLAKYSLGTLQQQTLATRWTPFLIEIGSKRPTATETSDIYFRVVPYDQVAVTTVSPPYFYQDVSIERALLDDAVSVVPLTGASGAVDVPGRGLTVLGQTRVDGKQLPVAFRHDDETGWNASALDANQTTGLLREKNEQVLFALGDSLLLDGEPLSEEPNFCGGNVWDVAANAEDPSPTFVVATEAGLAYLRGPALQGDTVLPATCTLLETAQGSPPSIPISRLVWMKSRNLFVGAAGAELYGIGVQLNGVPAARWSEGDHTTLGNPAPIRSLLVVGDERLQDLFVGTDRGLWVVRGGPGLSDAVHIPDCTDVRDDAVNRAPVSESAVTAMVQLGSRLFLGTTSGVAVTTSTREGEFAQNSPTGSSICARWLPTALALPTEGAGTESLYPVLPEGLDVADLVISDDTLYVVSRDRGLFFLHGGIQ